MPTFDVLRRTITAFKIGDTLLFKHYFDVDDLFSVLELYYNSDIYRFEVPVNERTDIEQILDEPYYELRSTTDFTPCLTVTVKGADTTAILRNTVIQQTRDRPRIFLMKDETSVEQAIKQGAKRPEDTGINTNELTWNIDGS